MQLTDVHVTVLPHGEGLPLPAHATPDAAGLDLRAAVPEGEPLALAPGAFALVPTGYRSPCPTAPKARSGPVPGSRSSTA